MSLHAGETINLGLSFKMEFGIGSIDDGGSVRSVFCAVFTMSLCALELKQTLISLLFQVIHLLNYINRL